jgi:hypothetical protein
MLRAQPALAAVRHSGLDACRGTRAEMPLRTAIARCRAIAHPAYA